MRTSVFALLALVTSAGLGACSRDPSGDDLGATEERMTPIDRLIVGKAMDYPADPTLRAALPTLKTSQAARRAEAWAVARRALEPVSVDGQHTIPRFQTWYAREEVLPMFDRLLRAQSADQLKQHVPPAPDAVAEAFSWEAGRAPSLPDWSEDRLAKRRAELAENGTASIGGPERILMSPALVGHLFEHYDSILGCMGGHFPGASDAPPSDTNFAPCVGEEFPEGAAIVKARWIPDTLPLDARDTTASELTKTITAGEWGPAPRTATPDEGSIYTMRLPNGVRMRLAALHVITKELRDWMWVTLFWSDSPTTDFGEDRPADFTGPFGNYKMCTVVDYDEGDTTAAPDGASDTSLAKALDATRGFGPRSWCSNPYLEEGPGNAKTNCIGCHQHAGTDLATESILQGDGAFPDGARARVRSNFPADYTFVTTTGMGLGDLLKSKSDQLTPH
jgi:hypothetical protein